MGLGPAACPRPSGRREVFLLAGYAVVACLLYGALLNLWFWPFLAPGTTFGFVPGAGFVENLHRFVLFDLTTSLGFDIPRAVTNAALIVVLGRPVLGALRRVSKRAPPSTLSWSSSRLERERPLTGPRHHAVRGQPSESRPRRVRRVEGVLHARTPRTGAARGPRNGSSSLASVSPSSLRSRTAPPRLGDPAARSPRLSRWPYPTRTPPAGGRPLFADPAPELVVGVQGADVVECTRQAGDCSGWPR